MCHCCSRADSCTYKHALAERQILWVQSGVLRTGAHLRCRRSAGTCREPACPRARWPRLRHAAARWPAHPWPQQPRPPRLHPALDAIDDSPHRHACSRRDIDRCKNRVSPPPLHDLSMTVLLQHAAHCLPAHHQRLSPSLTCVEFMPSARALIEVCQHDCSLPSCCLLLQHSASHRSGPSLLYQGCLRGEHAAVCAFSKRTLSRTDMHEAICAFQHVSSHPQMFAADPLEPSHATANSKCEVLPFAGSLIKQARCKCAVQHSCL